MLITVILPTVIGILRSLFLAVLTATMVLLLPVFNCLLTVAPSCRSITQNGYSI